MPKVEKNNHNNDVLLLTEIVKNLKKFNEEYFIVVNRPGNPLTQNMLPYTVTPIIPGRYHEDVIRAWNDVSMKMNQLIDEIEKATPERLSDCGLSGAQLQLKYAFCKEAYNHAKDWETREKMNEKPKTKSWYR